MQPYTSRGAGLNAQMATYTGTRVQTITTRPVARNIHNSQVQFQAPLLQTGENQFKPFRWRAAEGMLRRTFRHDHEECGGVAEIDANEQDRTNSEIDPYNIRTESNMHYKHKVWKWLEGMDNPFMSYQVSGGGIEYYIEQPFPATLSDTMSTYSDSLEQEEMRWRKNTKYTLMSYRNELEKPLSAQFTRGSSIPRAAVSVAQPLPAYKRPVAGRRKPVATLLPQRHNFKPTPPTLASSPLLLSQTPRRDLQEVSNSRHHIRGYQRYDALRQGVNRYK